MDLFIFIADAWGPVYGGINSFNFDLVIACARRAKKQKTVKICCVVPDLKDNHICEMKKEGIIPVSISSAAFRSPEAYQLIADKLKNNNELRPFFPDNCNVFCIGHDVYTGEISHGLSAHCKGYNIVFHHMVYESYYYLKSKPTEYNKKVELQRMIFENANMICPIGPKLAISAENFVRLNDDLVSMEILPGFQDFECYKKPDKRFRPIIFGRVEEGNQRIKQVPLGIDAYAQAVKYDKDKNLGIIGFDPLLKVIGYNDDESTNAEAVKLFDRLFEKTNSIIGAVPIMYTSNRDELVDYIREASLVMMLSYHEGFGLVGYEAIAAGVPLMLSENSGLYEFLEKNNLNEYVIHVRINGASNDDGYSDEDLKVVSEAILDMRKHEEEYKAKALKLRELLHNPEYSWDATANTFLTGVLDNFKVEMSRDSELFVNLKSFKERYDAFLANSEYNIDFNLSNRDHICIVEGMNAFMNLCATLEKHFGDKYSVLVYQVNSDDNEAVLFDFINDCKNLFGTENDKKGDDELFKRKLDEKLEKTIIVLNGFEQRLLPVFSELFNSLNKSTNSFYIFTVNETESPISFTKFSMINVSAPVQSLIPQKTLPNILTEEQRLMFSIISIMNRFGFSKRLINRIGRDVNHNCLLNKKEPVFKDVVELEKSLLVVGLIEEYSEYSYRIAPAYINAADELIVPNEIRSLGLSIVGDFYSHCYDWKRFNEPNFRWGQISCNCYKEAAQLDPDVKNDIKNKYENILSIMRKEVMNTSKYHRYFNFLEDFLNIYSSPDNKWLWYNDLHCATIIRPSPDILKRAYAVLETVKLDFQKTCDAKTANLFMHVSRLVTELEYENDNGELIESIKKRFKEAPDSCKKDACWLQFLCSIIIITCDMKAFSDAEFYLSEYQKYSGTKDGYYSSVLASLKTNIEIVNLRKNSKLGESTLDSIKKAYYKARNELHDNRLQGWTSGLWGEGLLLSGDSDKGNSLIRKSLNIRTSSGECNLSYKKWLERLLTYNQEPNTEEFIRNEIKRIEAQHAASVESKIDELVSKSL